MLAEISGKMPTALELWVWMLFLSIPTLVGLLHRRFSWIILVVALPFSAWLVYGAYRQAFLEPGFSECVQGEMGEVWIAHSITSACLPAAMALSVLCWQMKNRAAMPQPCTPPNGRAAAPVSNVGATEGPPSVS